MKLDDLDSKLRQYETAHDFCVLPGMYIVARIDGRSFTRLTKETIGFEAPFDPRFRDLMLATTEHLMGCGCNVVFGYTQSDEISLLFHRDDAAFGRKTRKLLSVLAGEASAKFSLLLGAHAAFDARISELPSRELVRDYFRWRSEDAHRNALGAHCYWALRKAGEDANAATRRISGLSTAEKNELLFQHGINFNELPSWQKRGAGLYWETHQKEALNPKTGQTTTAQRRRVRVDLELPMKDEYGAFVLSLLAESETSASV